MTKKNPSLVAAAEYLSAEAYAHYTRLKAAYKATATDERPTLLAALGLTALIMDEASNISSSLEMLEYTVTEQTGKEDTHKELAEVLRTYASGFAISPELTDYLRAVPAREQLRGEAEAEALRKRPKSRSKKALEIAPADMPAHYHSTAVLAQCLLTLPAVVAKATQIAETGSRITPLVRLLGASSVYFEYPYTPACLVPKR